ncbi:phosphate signaling complex protein PhoU [Sapientia aquatica]|uniref:Phosphate-specific transport system accessory protein PhoU n=1 Tax=Sapientia aquatica TaxID=1549640 RepID=A0A4R5W7P3_9BURK|nr:phosphate signaling complex protein PhoU [Sapientia aquatica]TDK68484.1 phosphate signaling complex protein PhoU [Sapientia aquatica]
MTGEHSSRQYDADLETLRSKVLLMGGLVENQFHDAIASFRSGNAELAASVITADSGVNQLEVDLDDACRHLILKRQPAANDLRTVMATVKVITDLERIGDEATKIARIAQGKDPQRGVMIFNDYDAVRGLASQVGNMLHDALDALARLDEKQAVKLIAKDAIIDQDFRAVMRNLITYMMEDPRTISPALDALWIAKAIERIGDHAKNIAEHVIFIVEGKDIRHSDYAATHVDGN